MADLIRNLFFDAILTSSCAWTSNLPTGIAVSVETETVSVNVAVAGSTIVADSARILINGVEVTPILVENTTSNWDISYVVDRADLWYNIQYTVQVQVTLADGEVCRHAWAFTTVSGVTKRVVGYQYTHLTQILGNNFPDFTRIRNSVGSVGQQLMNPIAIRIADARLENVRIHNNHFPQTADRNDMDLLYRHALGESFVFNERFFHDGNSEYITPTVTAIDGVAELAITVEEDIETFWNQALPDRVSSVSSSYHGNGMLVPYSDITASPFRDPVNVSVPGHVFVEILGGTTFVAIREGAIYFIEVKITGDTVDGGKRQQETLIFERAMVLKSRRKWKRITEIQVLGSDFSGGSELAIWNFPPQNSEKIDHDIQVVTPERHTYPSHWTLATNGYGSVLQQSAFVGSTGMDVFRGEPTVIHKEYELTDTADTPVTVDDFCLDRNRRFLYAANENNLYIFDKRPEYFDNFDVLTTRDSDPVMGMKFIPVSSSRQLATGGLSLGLKTVLRYPLRKVHSWRWSVILPDGTTRYVNPDNNLVLEAVNFVENDNKHSFTLQEGVRHVTLTTRGTHLFRLETVLDDKSTQLTIEPFHVDYLRAAAEYSLAKVYQRTPVTLPLGDVAEVGAIFDAVLSWDAGKVPEIRIAWDSDDRLRLFRNGMMYILDLRYDNALIDFDSKEIFFREGFSSSRVIA